MGRPRGLDDREIEKTLTKHEKEFTDLYSVAKA
jgi:hypothetical protein